ncbi:SNX8 [Cordylochernes scorpioides]|uniref:SNX8 n=1 Tax=Cordylochernes scorpioides TaxID=51811 RepID=A0ABY6L6M0_9ARAC|nr:SNX8 [Cordylochernes scorpioides]
MFIKLLVKSSLPKATLSQIWENVESQEGYLTRDGLYRALALTALAQQGVSTDGRGQLLKMPPSELPKPSLGDLTDLRMLGIQLRQEKNPSLLGLTYPEVCTLDSITLELVPGKKGLFLKHVEYEVTSQRYKTTVERRYTDFVALHELLLQRFPYRLIPSLPPKQGVSVVRENASFLETRRKALKRFLTLVARHPIIAEDKILHFFLTYVGPHKIREHFKGVQDEFYTHPRAAEARELVPLDTGVQLPLVKERLRQLGAAVGAVRDLLAQGAGELQAASSRWQQLGRQLSLLIHLGPGEWGAIPGAAGPWGLSGLLQPTLQALATASTAQGDSQEEQLVEQLNIYLDQLAAFKVTICTLD